LIFEVAADIRPDPVKGEYQLTDAIGLLVARGHHIAAVAADDPALVMGINTPGELEQAEKTVRSRSR
jgi:bifunctional N-acetylglucosamine-1-phosphate-uridyltransferase/glucosamine-1-phosphate-acetyltransferase GlmU-like protein